MECPSRSRILIPALPCMVGGSLSIDQDIGRRCFPILRKKMKEVMSMSDYELLMVVIAIMGLIAAVIR